MSLYAITGASGALGTFAVEQLASRVPADKIVLIVRTPEKVKALVDKYPGITVRQASYDDTAALSAALAGVSNLLLVSSSEVGKRAVQHKNVLESLDRSAIKSVVYTSLLNTDKNIITSLSPEHNVTEADIIAAAAEAGFSYALLRNSWYTENWVSKDTVAGYLASGAFASATEGVVVQPASRKDLAEAAVVALVDGGNKYKNVVLELAGEEKLTIPALAAEIAKQGGKKVDYVPLSEPEFAKLLESIGLPAGLAGFLANAEAEIAKGALQSDSHALKELLGREPTTAAQVVAAVLA